MLKKLSLSRFGKFNNQSIEFHPVTVFCGDNETGKSTIFDALLSVLCSRPRGQNEHWGRIRDRYDGHIPPESKFDGVYSKLDTNEFTNLYAIHAGKISIKWEEGSTKWLSELKRDFNSGFDPTGMMKEFEKDIAVKTDGTDKGSGSYNPKLAEWRQQQRNLERELDERKNRRSQILSKKQSTDSMQGEIDKLENEVKGLTDAVLHEKQKLDWEDKIMQKQKSNDALTEIRRLEELKTYCANSPFKTDESDILKDKRGKIESARSALGVAESSITEKKDSQRSRMENIVEIEKQLVSLKRSAENADALQSDISKILSVKVVEGKWNRAYIASSVASLIAGILLALFLAEPAIRLVSGFIGIIAAITFFVLARPKGTLSAVTSIKDLKGKWKINFGEELKEEEPDAVLRRLADFKSEYDVKKRDLEIENQNIAELKRNLLDLEAEIKRLSGEKQELEKELKDWLQLRGATDEMGYARGRAEYEKQEGELSELQQQFQEEDINALKTKHLSLMTALHNEGVPDKRTMPDEERNRLKNIVIAELEKKIEKLTQDKAQKEKDKGGTSGEIRGALDQSGLNDEIASHELEISRLEQQINDYELAKKATAKALNILKDMERDSEILFKELAKEVGVWLSHVVQDREIKVGALTEANIKMQDAGGQLRLVENLSSGTYDTFMFAMRLALALKSASGQWRPLILDEPFLYMDSQRTKNALKLLKAFQEETKTKGAEWQIILFTKEKELRDLVKETFQEPAVYDLTVGAGEINRV